MSSTRRAFLALPLALIGCMTVGTTFDIERANQLEPGVSTINDATQLLGPAKSETTRGDNSKILQWQYARGTLVGGSGAHLAILFDASGTMVRVVHRSKI